jgi:molecular chaperone DnaJ
MKGRSVSLDLEISLEDAAFGKDVKIQVPRTEKCKKCKGSGAAPGTSPKKCGTCGGIGQIRSVTQSGFGQFVRIMPCNACRGEGQVIEKPCPTCGGRGAVRKKSEIDVHIKPGVDTGNRVVLPEMGEAGFRGGPPGDLYVMIYVRSHPKFHREGKHLMYDTDISFAQAALGDEIEVPTLKGTAKLKIPKGTQTHTPFRLKGEGMPDVRGGKKGDLFVRVIVQTPTKMTEKQKALLLELEGKDKPKKKGKLFK